MPSALTYPGVYIEEISSGVRTITGVATSITAFIGRTLRGPVNEPTTVNNFGEFERLFGGLAPDHTVAYAILDFFGNGGSQAIIVRLYKPFFLDDVTRKAALATATGLAQTAANAIMTSAATAAGLGGATPASVAVAANAQVAAAGVPGKAALLRCTAGRRCCSSRIHETSLHDHRSEDGCFGRSYRWLNQIEFQWPRDSSYPVRHSHGRHKRC